MLLHFEEVITVVDKRTQCVTCNQNRTCRQTRSIPEQTRGLTSIDAPSTVFLRSEV